MQNAVFALYIIIYITIGQGYTDTSLAAIDELHISSFAGKEDTIYAGTWGYGLFCSDNKGKTWKRFNRALTNMFIYSLHIYDSSFLVGTDGGGIFKYNIQEKQWKALNSGNIGNTIFTVLEKDGVILASSWSHGLYRSENNGKKWEKVTKGLADSVIYSLCSSDKYLYAGGAKNGVYQSRDRGKSWTLIGLKKRTITCLYSVNNDIWCGTWESGLYYFSETDSVWHRSSFNFSDNIDALAYSPKNNVLYCANKDDGVFKSEDYDRSWFSIGLIQNKTFSLLVFKDMLFAGTWGKGIFLYDETSEWNKLENRPDSSFHAGNPDSLKDSDVNISAAAKSPSVNKIKHIIDTRNTSINEDKVIFINSNFPKKYSIPVKEQQRGTIIIYVYDYSGQQVYTRTETINSMEKKIISLDLKEFFTGIYVISIHTVVKENFVRRILAH